MRFVLFRRSAVISGQHCSRRRLGGQPEKLSSRRHLVLLAFKNIPSRTESLHLQPNAYQVLTKYLTHFAAVSGFSCPTVYPHLQFFTRQLNLEAILIDL
jgi:hypothetical protein